MPHICLPLFEGASTARRRRSAPGGGKRGLATVYLGLGSNVGDRHANLLRAYKGLREVNRGWPQCMLFMFDA